MRCCGEGAPVAMDGPGPMSSTPHPPPLGGGGDLGKVPRQSAAAEASLHRGSRPLLGQIITPGRRRKQPIPDAVFSPFSNSIRQSRVTTIIPTLAWSWPGCAAIWRRGGPGPGDGSLPLGQYCLPPLPHIRIFPTPDFVAVARSGIQCKEGSLDRVAPVHT